VGLLLVLSGIAKCLKVGEFLMSVRAYGFVLRKTNVRLVGITIVTLELACGVLLISGRLLPWSGVAALALLVGFSSLVAIALVRGKSDIKCGCMFLGRNRRIGWYICLRNGALTCLLIPDIFRLSPALMASCAAILIWICLVTMDPEGEKGKVLSLKTK
jgi:hypothetical protein